MLITMMLAERQFKPLRPVIDSQDLEENLWEASRHLKISIEPLTARSTAMLYL